MPAMCPQFLQYFTYLSCLLLRSGDEKGRSEPLCRRLLRFVRRSAADDFSEGGKLEKIMNGFGKSRASHNNSCSSSSCSSSSDYGVLSLSPIDPSDEVCRIASELTDIQVDIADERFVLASRRRLQIRATRQ
ncbi:hypothetical protein Trydic_g6241 [Trypoxylus dichotomus]